MSLLSPLFQRRWTADPTTGQVVPDRTPLAPDVHWYIQSYSQVDDFTLVQWIEVYLGAGEHTGGEILYKGTTPIAYASGALDLYAPHEFEETEREKVQDENGRLVRSYQTTVWDRINRTQGAYGCPAATALALRDPRNQRFLRPPI